MSKLQAPFRVDHGSFLRPKELVEAKKNLQKEKLHGGINSRRR